MSLVSIAEQCNHCSAFFSPSDLRTIGESIKICGKCAQSHAIQVENFVPPDFCQGCYRKTAEIAAEAPGYTFSMFVHWKDGILQLLCRACSDRYIPQRRDLFRGSRFADERKL